jgi:hypothetical protein
VQLFPLCAPAPSTGATITDSPGSATTAGTADASERRRVVNTATAAAAPTRPTTHLLFAFRASGITQVPDLQRNQLHSCVSILMPCSHSAFHHVCMRDAGPGGAGRHLPAANTARSGTSMPRPAFIAGIPFFNPTTIQSAYPTLCECSQVWHMTRPRC